jgi:hypothetical protein
MGYQNVMRVYIGWNHLKDRPFRMLAYMALVSRDNDAAPWFGLGHEALAEHALGLTLPADGAKRDQVLRRVRRHITPLVSQGAIETVQRATSAGRGGEGSHVVYRLNLSGPRGLPGPGAQFPTT